MKKLIKKLLFSIAILLYSCTDCGQSKQIEIPVALKEHLSNGNISIPYCKLLDEALTGNQEAVIRFSKLDTFDGEASYDHGTVLVRLIFFLGESKYISCIQNLSCSEKKGLYSTIYVGLDYGGYGKKFTDVYIESNGSIEYNIIKYYIPSLYDILKC